MNRMPVTIREGGLVSVVIPSDPALVARRDGVLREAWRVEQADWDRVRAELPHRSEVRPTRTDEGERHTQDRSLGRENRRGALGNLHPMRSDVYLLALARRFEELLPRVDRMRAEMEAEELARPEEFKGREPLLFDVPLFIGSVPAFPPELALAERAELSLAAFVIWVADPSSMMGAAYGRDVLLDLHLWSRRSQWAFSAWSRSPFFPQP